MSTTTPATPKAPRASYYAEQPLAAVKVDAEAGILRDVAIMSIGEAAGHGERVDMATLQALFQLGAGRSVKAFLNHSWNPNPTEVVGVFTGLYIDAAAGVLRAAQFQALNSWRKHAPQAFDTLFELAATAPETFGVSVVINRELEDATDGGTPYIRPTLLESADFVSSPAANRALFSKKSEEVDSVVPAVKPNNALAVSNFLIQQKIMKAIYSKYSERPAALAYAVKQLAEGEGVTEDQAIAATEAKLAADDVAAKDATIAAQAAKIAELEAAIAALQPKEVEVEEMSKAKAELESKLSAESAKSAEFSAKLEEANKQIAEYAARARRFGTAPVKTGKAGESQRTATRSEFNKMNHAERDQFFRDGGKLTDEPAA